MTKVTGIYIYIYIYIYSILHILIILTMAFPDTRNVKYLPIFRGSYSNGLVIFFSSRHGSSS